MARIRTIKPDAFTSESLSEVPRGTRWTFAGLWTYADDAGRGRDDARLVKAALYPIDDDVTLEDVRADIDLLVGIGAVCRYVVDGRAYLHMPKWGHQKINRPTPAKSPPCPLHEDGGSGHVLIPDDSLSPHGVVTEGSTWERKGREGKGNREGKGGVGDESPEPPKSLALVTDDRPDVEAACSALADAIEANGSKRPTVTGKWRTEARLMLDRDGRTVEQVTACIRWLFVSTNRDAIFWRANVRSMPKLRAEYDRLRELAERTQAPTVNSSRNAEFQAQQERAMARAVEREREMGVRP